MNKEDFEALKIMSEKRVQYTEDNMQTKLREIPLLYQEFLRYQSVQLKEKIDLDLQLEEIFGERFKYYKFDDSYNWGSKTEIESRVYCDKLYIDKKRECEQQNIVIKYIEETLANIKSMGYSIRNEIEYLKYQAGS